MKIRFVEEDGFLFIMMNHNAGANRFFASLIVVSGVFVAFGIVYAQAKPNTSLVLKKQSAGLFEMTIKDADGIKEFSLRPEGRSSYGGEVQCPKTFSSKNVVFDIDDFSPPMKAYVIDCLDNQVDFEISEPNAKGVAKGKVISPATAPSLEGAPSPSAQTPTQTSAPAKATAAPSAPAPKKSLVDITYPVKELGNCKDQESCLSYCDDETHITECFAFAKKHNLLSKDEVKKADKFAELGGKGPGGCTSQKSCETYCSNINRMDECLEWGEKNGFISDKELAEAKKVQAAVKGGAKLPGGCESKQKCEAFCSEPENIDECLAFAESSGFLPPEELAEAKKMSAFMKRGETPGNCRSKDKCEVYCADENNLEECITFAEKAGMISPEEIEMFKKTGGKGPGGCKGKVQCEAYCNDPEHQEACFMWAQENGLVKEEDLKRMREGTERFKEEFEKMPPEIVECLKLTVGEKVLNDMLDGKPVFARDMGEKMQACFAQTFQDFGGEFNGSGGGPGGEPGDEFPGGFSGPGGCSNPEECFKFCGENPEECEGFGPPGRSGGGHENGEEEIGEPNGFSGSGESGSFPGKGGFSGPGGCKTPNECMKFCQENPEECEGFGPPGGGGSMRIIDDNGKGFIPPSGQSRGKLDGLDEGEVDESGDDGQLPSDEEFQKQSEQQFQKQYQEELQKQMQQQYQQQTGGQSPSPTGGGVLTICPAMPTVDSCPQGQRKEQVFSSPECGTYYACVPEAGAGGGTTSTLGGMTAPIPENATVHLQLLFPGQYENTKFSIIVSDPEGLREFGVKKADGSWLYGGNPSCQKEVRSGTVTIARNEFPLGAYVIDCGSGQRFELQVNRPAEAGYAPQGFLGSVFGAILSPLLP